MRKSVVRTCLAAITFSLAAGLFAGSAHADDGLGADEVTLKNGGMVRGSVVSVEPGTKVVLLEAGSKTPRTIPWAEVADVERGKYSAAKSSTEAAAEPEAKDAESSAAPGKQGIVRLHIESEPHVQLHEELGTAYAAGGGYAVAVSAERVACTSPCDRVIDASRGQRFMVSGDGVPASEPFYLNDQTGDTTVKVDPGSNGRRGLGGTFATLGILGALTGGTLLIVGAVGESSSTKDDLMLASGVTLGISAAVLAGGIVLLATSGTNIKIAPHSDHSASAASPRTARAPRYWMGEF